MALHECFNPELHSLTPYQPGKAIETLERELGLSNIIKLASNENRLGPSPAAQAAAIKCIADAHLYPDGSYFRLKDALAEKHAIAPNQILVGNGSDEILSLAARTFLRPGKNAIVSEYAFSTFGIVTRSALADCIRVPALDYGCDLVAMARAITPKTGIVFIANPNNPTGTYVTHEALSTFLKSIPKQVIVLCDEAYFGFIQAPDYPKSLTLLAEHENLIITRTFSKLYGLAGLRIGYGIAHPEIMGYFNRLRLPFNINIAGMEAAIAALKDKEHIEKSLLINTKGRQQLITGFQNLTIKHLPAESNFITVDFEGKIEALHVFEKLLHQGIIVRPLQPYQLKNHLRITIGLGSENTRLLECLQKIMENK